MASRTATLFTTSISDSQAEKRVCKQLVLTRDICLLTIQMTRAIDKSNIVVEGKYSQDIQISSIVTLSSADGASWLIRCLTVTESACVSI